jgi:hypothetical protein
MRHSRLVLPALAFVVSVAWVTQGLACDQNKGTAAASSKSAVCTAEMAAHCTPEMMAACKAKGASAAAIHCPGMMGVAMTGSYDHCLGKSGAAAAGAAGSCAAHATTMAAGECPGHEANGKSAMAFGNCDACADMAMCDKELIEAGTRTQVVPLKNGVMFVYTAENRGRVTAVQSALARRTERLNQLMTAGDKARLCAECKSMRGAMASGRLTREVINIEGGALTLVTSDDPAMVAKIKAMTDSDRLAHKI